MASTAPSRPGSSHAGIFSAATSPRSLSNRGTSFGSHASRQACDVCRVRKTKCDRAVPKCGRCIRLGEPCGYDGRRHSLKDALTARVTELQERVRRAEAQLAGSQSNMVPIQPAHSSSHDSNSSVTSTNTIALMPSGSSGDVHDALDNFIFPQERLLTSQPPSLPPTPTGPRSYLPEAPQIMTEEDPFGMDLDWIPGYQFPVFSGPLSTLDIADVPPLQNFDSEPHSPTILELELLHQAYSSDIHHALPFLDLERFQRELAAEPQSTSLMALSFGMALLGSTLLPKYSHLTDPCYDSARRCIEQCERDESGTQLVSLNLLQAITLVVRYEITDRQLRRGYMTLGRAIRLMKMLGLHTMDRDSRSDLLDALDLGMRLPLSEDALVLEERRRTFWTLYILESYVTTRTGIPGELGEIKAFDVRLPAPGSLDSSFQPTAMPRIGHAVEAFSDPGTSTKSSFAGCVLMVELALECFSHSRRRYLGGSGPDGFWDNHYRLIKSFNDRAITLNQYVKADAVKSDPISLSVQLNLCAAEIFFHETATHEAERQGLPKHVAGESQRLGVEAAFRIAHTMEANSPSQQPKNGIFNIQATFLAWPLAMALKALCPVLTSPSNNVTSNAVAHSLRLLKNALDAAEPLDGHWHTLTAPVELRLQEWDRNIAYSRSL